jgi:dihydroorotate dehydrogenase (fumarate)
MTSALLQHGIDHVKVVLKEISEWMLEREYESIEEMQGSMSQQSIPDPSVYIRSNYMKVLSSYTLRPRYL